MKRKKEDEKKARIEKKKSLEESWKITRWLATFIEENWEDWESGRIFEE